MDNVLKQRLIGAAILIALAVIFLPMLFDDSGEEPVQRQLALDLPERSEEGQREIRRLPLDPEQARRAPPEAEAVPDTDQTPVPEPDQPPQGDISAPAAAGGSSDRPHRDATVEETEPPVVAEETAPEPETESAEDAPDEAAAVAADRSATEGNWAVQVAVFSNRATANDIRERLESLGHAVALDVLVRDQAELFRLRTGPYTGRSEAEQARSQIAATVAGVDPALRELGTTGAATERFGFAVQVGSFASRNNAERLVAQLRADNHDAFIHAEESGGRTIWRVRVGTYDERGPAESLLQELREHDGLEGIVVSHP